MHLFAFLRHVTEVKTNSHHGAWKQQHNFLAISVHPTMNFLPPFPFESMLFIYKNSLDHLFLTGFSVLVLSLQCLLLCGAFALRTEVCVGGGLTFLVKQTIFLPPQSGLYPIMHPFCRSNWSF